MKNALITGGSRGIGRAIVLHSAAQGWSVALNYAGNEQAAQQTVTEAAKLGAQALAIRGDISSERT